MTIPESVANDGVESLWGRAGIGLRHPHVAQLIEEPQADLAWVEVHTENYMAEGGPRLRQLELIRERYALSFHGVGLSLGSADPPDPAHLARIRRLVDRFAPALLSEHIAWSIAGGHYLNDLFPIPYTEEALSVVARNVAIAQDALGRPLMVENPSSYLRFVDSTVPECEFVAEIARRAGCGILLDVNNIHVSAHNHGFDVADYLETIPSAVIGEFHLAGHATCEIEGRPILIDDHASRVDEPVWRLFDATLERYGPRPTLIEWDNGIPPLPVLLDERAAAQRRLDRATAGGPVPTLREVQAAFAHGILDPSPENLVADRIVAAGITPERRLAVYRNNVLLSLRRVLEGTFPASRRLLGPQRFAKVARAFIRTAPPERPQLLTYGTGFPAFLERAAEAATVACLADVARLEWAREEAYYAADASPLSAKDLTAIPIARYPALHFQLHPTLRLIRSAGPVSALWQAAGTGSAEEISTTIRNGCAEQVLVLRPEMTVTVRPIAAADLLLLEGLGEGLPLAEAAARAQAADAGFDLQAALALHLAGGSFASCR